MPSQSSKKISRGLKNKDSLKQELHENSSRRKWNKKEDGQLSLFVKKIGTKWLQIAENMPDRSASQCQQRWKRLKTQYQRFNGTEKQKWSSSEDQKLLQLIKIYGSKWNRISEFIPNKDRRAIRNRFVNVLDPTLNHNQMTEDEDVLICKLYEKFGSQWSKIAQQLSGRSDNMVKNRFNYQLKQKYFSTPNLYQIQNLNEFQRQRNQSVDMMQQHGDLIELESRSEGINEINSCNSYLMIKDQDSCIIGGYESIPYFSRIMK